MPMLFLLGREGAHLVSLTRLVTCVKASTTSVAWFPEVRIEAVQVDVV